MNLIGLQTLLWREIERILRVWIQTLVSPWINALLYILVFGVVVGRRIGMFAGVEYIDFVLPGILMMSLINAGFSHSSFSVYFQRFTRHIEELLVAPLSSMEMLIGYALGGVMRGLIVGLGVYIIAVFFSAASLAHFWLFLFYSISVAMIFSLLGILIGLWSENFEQLSLLLTFVITPLTFVGGVFNSVVMLPPLAQMIARWNPFFYFVDGLRYAMIGVREANVWIGVAIIVFCILVLGGLTWRLFSKGWKIRV